MTWPFENDTSAIVKKLAGRSMQADKRNKAFLLLTIAISVCMVFSILLISTGTQEKFKNTQRNKAQIGILGVTDEQTAQLHQNENITWVGEYSAIGVFYVENKTITVAYGNEDYFLHQEEKTFQGSVPQKADEIMLPQNYLDFLGKSYQTGDTISIDLTGTGQKSEYTLSGVLNNTKESNGYFIYVSKELAQDLAKDSFQVTAYTRLNTDAISSTAILNFAGKAIQNTGIVEEQVMLTEYSAVMSGVITSGIPIPVPLLAALTAILAATIVYGVFYTKIVKNVQMFGQLRTVGMTKRQIKRMASKEGRLYALAGIPLGLVIAEDIAQVGDTLKIEGRAFDGRTFDVEAVVVGTYNRSDLMEDSPVVPGSPYFIMTYDTAKKLTGITEQTGILAIKNSEGCFDEVLTAVQKIADKNEKIEVNTIEQTIKNIQHRYSASINALYMTSAILFVFGSISLMNMLMVDFQNRKREFGLLEAVGVTRKQLKAMLNREIGIYLGGSLAISLICGSIFSVIVCRRLDAINHCITLKLPWFFLLALICVLLVIYLVFSMYSKMELKKASILSAIKSE